MKPQPDRNETTPPPAEQAWRTVVTKLLPNSEESRPLINCECALWGSPCPHSFWSEEKPAASVTKAA